MDDEKQVSPEFLGCIVVSNGAKNYTSRSIDLSQRSCSASLINPRLRLKIGKVLSSCFNMLYPCASSHSHPYSLSKINKFDTSVEHNLLEGSEGFSDSLP